MFLSKEEFVVQNRLIINKFTLKGKVLSVDLRSKKITFLDKDLKEKTVTLKHTKEELYSLRDYYKKYLEKFNEMDKELKKNNPALSKEDDLLLAIVKGATPLDRATALQEYTALITDKATGPLKAELTQSKAELTEKKDFIDDINDCFTFTQVKQYNKQLLRDRKDIVLSTAKLNEVAAELGIPVNKIDNPIEYSPYRRVNAYPRKVWMTAYPDIKLPEKESK